MFYSEISLNRIGIEKWQNKPYKKRFRMLATVDNRARNLPSAMLLRIINSDWRPALTVMLNAGLAWPPKPTSGRPR
jgi:hypothetical protein